MKLKHVKIADETKYTTDQLDFLGSIDSALDGVLTKSSTDLEAVKKDTALIATIQKQVDELFVKTDRMNKPPATKDEVIERKLNNQWVRSFLRNDQSGMQAISKELPPAPDFEEKTLTTDTAGAVVPELLQREIFRITRTAGVCRRDMKYLPFAGAGNDRKLPVQLTAASVGWIAEGGAIPAITPTPTFVMQTLHKIATIVQLTEELHEDQGIDMVDFLGTLIGEAVAAFEDSEFLTAAVAAPRPAGVLRAVGTVVETFPATGITADILNNGMYRIPAAAMRGAKFYMHPAQFSLIQRMRAPAITAGDNAGNYLVHQPADAMQEPTLWGYPIVKTDVLPATTAAGAPLMFFANLNKTCVYGDKQGLRLKLLTEAGQLAYQDNIALRVIKRVGYVPILPAGIVVFQRVA